MKWKVLFILLLVFLVLLVFGGVVFHLLESRHEAEVRAVSRGYIEALLARKECVSREELAELARVVVRAYDQGVFVLDNTTMPSTNWDIVSGVLFAGTVATTIGYGNMSPSTPGGRAFCVMFALFSIPVCLVLLAGIGDKLKLAYTSLHSSLEDRCTPNQRIGQVIRTVLVSSVGVILFLFIPSAIFVAIEGWGYGEALYYCFITLTTVGFGDFVPGIKTGVSYRAVYRVCVWLWILLGLAWLSTVISLVQDLCHSLLQRVGEKVDKVEEDISNGVDKMNERAKTGHLEESPNSPALTL